MTPAAALLDRLLDIVVTTELDQPGRISVGLAVLALAISKLPAAERDDACDGSPPYGRYARAWRLDMDLPSHASCDD